MSSENSGKEITKAWLNKSFLEKVLTSSEGGECVTVTSYEVMYATAKGDNYLSEMFRVEVNFTLRGMEESTSLIVKAEPENEDLLPFLRDGNLFLKENVALKTAIPRMHRLIEEACKGDTKPFAAKCLYGHIGHPQSVIVMEDLKAQGFKMADRNKGLDLKHSLLVLRTIARFHAASAVLLKKEPELFRVFSETPFDDKMKKHMESFFVNGTETTAKEVEKWPEFGKPYAEKLSKISEIAFDYLQKKSEVNDKNFNVVIHADLWLNNIMFKYSESTGEVEDLRFVDFQFSHISDAAHELQYFLHTTPSIELINDQHILVEEYHKALGETFDLLGHKYLHPSLEKLHNELNNRGLHAVIVACACLPIIMVDDNNVPDFEKVVNSEDKVKYSQRYKDMIKKFLPVFEKKRWLSIENIQL